MYVDHVKNGLAMLHANRGRSIRQKGSLDCVVDDGEVFCCNWEVGDNGRDSVMGGVLERWLVEDNVDGFFAVPQNPRACGVFDDGAIARGAGALQYAADKVHEGVALEVVVAHIECVEVREPDPGTVRRRKLVDRVAANVVVGKVNVVSASACH